MFLELSRGLVALSFVVFATLPLANSVVLDEIALSIDGGHAPQDPHVFAGVDEKKTGGEGEGHQR